MVPVPSLIVPILLSAVLVFLASSIIHMVLTWHKNDFQPVPSEDAVMAALRPFSIPPGNYSMPYAAGMADMKSAAFQEKVKQGPVALLTVLPSDLSGTGKSLALWFVYIVVVSLMAAYVAGRAVGAGAPYMEVFRFVATAAILAYSGGWPLQSIWFGRKWSASIRSMIDGVIYGLLTAGVFGWLWPA